MAKFVYEYDGVREDTLLLVYYGGWAAPRQAKNSSTAELVIQR
jgi:hypothetical protein